MPSVKMYKVFVDGVFTQDPSEVRVFHQENLCRLTDGEPLAIMGSQVDFTVCQVHRICKMMNGRVNENLIAFDPSFKEMLLQEVLDDEKKQAVDAAIRRVDEYKKIAKESGRREFRVRQSVCTAGFFKRLKYLLGLTNLCEV